VEEAGLMQRGERAEAGPALATAAPAAPATPGTPATPAAPGTPATSLASVRASVPRWVNLPYAIVFAATAGGLAWTWLGPRHVETGMLAVASAVLAAAVLRLILPERRAGLLLARRRVIDVLALTSLGAGIMAVVLVLPPPV
jgi:hypothetical protein